MGSSRRARVYTYTATHQTPSSNNYTVPGKSTALAKAKNKNRLLNSINSLIGGFNFALIFLVFSHPLLFSYLPIVRFPLFLIAAVVANVEYLLAWQNAKQNHYAFEPVAWAILITIGNIAITGATIAGFSGLAPLALPSILFIANLSFNTLVQAGVAIYMYGKANGPHNTTGEKEGFLNRTHTHASVMATLGACALFVFCVMYSGINLPILETGFNLFGLLGAAAASCLGIFGTQDFIAARQKLRHLEQNTTQNPVDLNARRNGLQPPANDATPNPYRTPRRQQHHHHEPLTSNNRIARRLVPLEETSAGEEVNYTLGSPTSTPVTHAMLPATPGSHYAATTRSSAATTSTSSSSTRNGVDISGVLYQPRVGTGETTTPRRP